MQIDHSGLTLSARASGWTVSAVVNCGPEANCNNSLPFHRRLATLERKPLAATELARGRTAKAFGRELAAEH